MTPSFRALWGFPLDQNIDSRAGREEDEEWKTYDLHFESRLLEKRRPSWETIRARYSLRDGGGNAN